MTTLISFDFLVGLLKVRLKSVCNFKRSNDF